MKYFFRLFLIKFEYKEFSEYSPKSLFKEISLFILRLISIDSRATCFIPKSLLMSEAFSKSILWEGLKNQYPAILKVIENFENTNEHLNIGLVVLHYGTEFEQGERKDKKG